MTLSAVLIVIAGGYNVIWGWGALGKRELFDEASLFYSNLSFWGWLFLLIGVLQIVTAVLLFMRHALGVALAAVGATTSAFLAFFSLLSSSVRPRWPWTHSKRPTGPATTGR